MVKRVLKEIFGRRGDLQDLIETAVPMKMGKHEYLTTFIDKASKAFEEAGCTEGRNFVLLFRAILNTDEIRKFSVLHTRNPCSKLFVSLQEYNDSQRRFASNENSAFLEMRHNARQTQDMVAKGNTTTGHED